MIISLPLSNRNLHFSFFNGHRPSMPMDLKSEKSFQKGYTHTQNVYRSNVEESGVSSLEKKCVKCDSSDTSVETVRPTHSSHISNFRSKMTPTRLRPS